MRSAIGSINLASLVGNSGLMAGVFALAGLLSPSRADAFQIMVDVNQVNSSEVTTYNTDCLSLNPFLGVDGAWVVDTNSDFSVSGNTTEWQTLLSNLNSSNWTVTEDLFAQEGTAGVTTGNWYDVGITLGVTVNQSMVYIDDSNTALWTSAFNTLHYDYSTSYDQIYGACNYGVNFNPVVVLARIYSGDPETAVNAALADSLCGGVVFEDAPVAYNTPGDSSSGMPSSAAYVANNLIAGIEYCVSQGKECYLLMPGQPGGNYDYQVLDTMTYIAAQCWANGIMDPANTSKTVLNSSHVHVVVACYGRASSYVGLLTGDNSTGYGNSMLAAVADLKAFRSFGSY